MNKKMIVAPILLVGTLTVALGWRLWVQDAALRAPAGGSGVVEGTEYALSTRLTARVLSLEVEEGEAVEEGDVLVRMDCRDAEAILMEAESKLAAGRAQVEAAEAVAGASKHVYSAARAAAEAARAQAEAAERQAARLSGITQDVSAAQLDQTTATATGFANQADAAVASGRATGSQSQAASAQVEAAILSVQAGEAAIERARLLVAECDVKAPRAGIVELLPFEPGELALPGSVVVRLVDLDHVRAVFYLPNADLAAAQPGGSAWVEADAWPESSFVGKIATIASSAEFTPRNIQTRTDRDRLVYRVEVSLDNPDHKLRPGMPVEVSLEERD